MIRRYFFLSESYVICRDLLQVEMIYYLWPISLKNSKVVENSIMILAVKILKNIDTESCWRDFII